MQQAEGCTTNVSTNVQHGSNYDCLVSSALVSDAEAEDHAMLAASVLKDGSCLKSPLYASDSYKESAMCDDDERKGIVYLARVPPFMNVTKLRQYMSSFGTVERIYLTPEDQGTLCCC